MNNNTITAHPNQHSPTRAACWFVLLLSVGFLWGCNLDFDPAQFGPIDSQTSETGGGGGSGGGNTSTSGSTSDDFCRDADNDGYFNRQGCGPKDQIDCDDTRAFVNPAEPELCDNLDNNCDGNIDEGEEGRQVGVECYPGPIAQTRFNQTACRAGVRYCVDGAFPEDNEENCEGFILPAFPGETDPQVRCDGIDNDCDGQIDPACPCPAEGATRNCFEGSPDRADVGSCRSGSQRCVRQGDELVWGECLGQVLPGTETCGNSDEDNDCNGFVDDVQGLDEECDSGLNGACSRGAFACSEGGELICSSSVEPTDEVCDGIDNNCDGFTDEGVTNACGSCGVLPGEPGEACGACGNGVFACNDDGELECVGEVGRNACNGCGALENADGEEAEEGADCGACGVYECSGVNSVRCADPGNNACGGCGEIVGGDLLGASCGDQLCGTFVCSGENSVRCEDPGTNACGGCVELTGNPGDECGPCGGGVYECQGANGVICRNARPVNACGTCTELSNTPGEECGACGRWECDPDNADFVVCNDTGLNACGGCGTLANAPGEECGQCGSYVCESGTTVCRDGGLNACGGCEELDGQPPEVDLDGDGVVDFNEDFNGNGLFDDGEPCGECGVYECTGTESVECADPGLNACGGCGELVGSPSEDLNDNGALDPGEDYNGNGQLDVAEECGECGEYVCSINRTQVVCADPGLNSCGGCGDVVGEPLGEDCGQCGSIECSGPNASACDDPGLNDCLGCNELTNIAGDECAPCGGGRSARYMCSGANLVCDNRDCESSSTIRLFNFLVSDASCTTSADCGPGYQCSDMVIPVDGSPDTCVPIFELATNNTNTLLPSWTWDNSTPYAGDGFFIVVETFNGWLNSDPDDHLGATAWEYPRTTPFNQEWTGVLAETLTRCSDDSECTDLVNGTCDGDGLCSYACTEDTDCPSGSCLQGECLLYNIVDFRDLNDPTPGMVKLRTANIHSGFMDGIEIEFTDTYSNESYLLTNGVPYGEAGEYINMPQGFYTMTIRTREGLLLGTFAERAYRAGDVFTLFMSGRRGTNTVWITPSDDRAHEVISF